eukprot:CAMPEP_0203982658 /NCGR_PEP_ID=MMETSP0360-20130528/3188_1 /ASSEMBLY_ACC=CAM_ASM_000342 /TAXON_ID=268821 /ORGANISM="Scrippsiella Hangoei, Strain SHTV-5" /LENGTH=40 /DNA_ID= /DNA_START= /DNA_END= /DNA_ORIENTATION=
MSRPINPRNEDGDTRSDGRRRAYGLVPEFLGHGGEDLVDV